MNSVTDIGKIMDTPWITSRPKVRVQLLPQAYSAEVVVRHLSLMQGHVDIYCWYEGIQGLPVQGAVFMRDSIFEPLMALKKDVKLYLYSLKGWDFKNAAGRKQASSDLIEAINRIDKTAVECISSASFFQYCEGVSQDSDLYKLINEELPKKKWLFNLSEGKRKCGIKVASLFDQNASLVDCIKELDVNFAYSSMQYVEGYYLIREAVSKGMKDRKKQIQIAFVLPNDEGKYYKDFPSEIEKMLLLEFGDALTGIEIGITFLFFEYGEQDSRPYVDKRPKAPKVNPGEVGSYFSYLKNTPINQEMTSLPFCRDIIHNLNERNYI